MSLINTFALLYELGLSVFFVCFFYVYVSVGIYSG